MPDKNPANDRSSDSLRLELGAEATVELRHLVSAASIFAAFIQEVSRTMAKDPSAVVWTVAIEPGSVVLPATPQAEPHLRAALLEAIPCGLALIEEKAERPPYFTDQALAQAQALANLASDELPVRVRNGAHDVKLSKRLVANIEAITREPQPRLGSIEGRLEEVNIHGRPTFQVWERLSGTKVLCKAGDAITLEDLSEALGKRVEVRGRIREPKTGMTIDVKQLRVFPAEEDLPTAEDVRGILNSAS